MAISSTEIEHLKALEEKHARFRFDDGEVAVGTVLHIDDEYNDVIYELLKTNRAEKYTTDRPWKHTVFAAKFQSIMSFEFVDDESGD